MSRFFAYKVTVLPYIQNYGYKCGTHTPVHLEWGIQQEISIYLHQKWKYLYVVWPKSYGFAQENLHSSCLTMNSDMPFKLCT